LFTQFRDGESGKRIESGIMSLRDTQIIWSWNDGEPPYNVWDSNGLIAEGYPYEWMIRDVEPGKTYTLAVQDAAKSTDALTAKAPYYTFTTGDMDTNSAVL